MQLILSYDRVCSSNAESSVSEAVGVCIVSLSFLVHGAETVQGVGGTTRVLR